MADKAMGPDYDYSAQIRPPSGSGGLGMSSKGTIGALTSNVKGLMGYVKVLVTGTGASKTGQPLGTKYFLDTIMKCNDTITDEKVTRSIYINNIPDGTIPLPIPRNGMSMQFPAFRGLMPGLMSNLAQLNPMKILQAFTTGPSPYCQKITMETSDSNNRKGQATAYVTNDDINVMPKSWFNLKGHPKPNTNDPKKQGFTTMHSLQPANVNYSKMPNDLLVRIYFALLGLLGMYFLLKMLLRKKYIIRK